MEIYNVLDLFAGFGTTQYVSVLIGGQWKIVGHVDFSNYCCDQIRQRIKYGEYQPANVHCMDVWEFIESGIIEAYKGIVECITAGPPCQGFSVAGKGLGEKDPRNGFPVLLECCRILRPRFVFMENSPNLANFDYFTTILGSFSEIGYDAKWDVFSAAASGANQIRKRLWILAYLNESGPCIDRSSRYGNGKSLGKRGESTDIIPEVEGSNLTAGINSIGCNEVSECTGRETGIESVGKDSETISDTFGTRLEFSGQTGPQQKPGNNAKGRSESFECDQIRIVSRTTKWWDADPADDAESGLVRLVYGVPNRRNRIEALGNSWIPAVASKAWETLKNDI